MRKVSCLTVLLFLAFGIFLPPSSSAQLQNYGTALCGDTVNFYCLRVEKTRVKSGVLADQCGDVKEKIVNPTWSLLWSNTAERDIVMKINRRNTRLRLGETIAAPYDLKDKTYFDFAPFPLKTEPTGEKILIWDPRLLAFAAYDETGFLIRWGAAVGGKNYCPDLRRSCQTKVGEFRIIKTAGPGYRSSKYPIGCKGHKCSAMPWAMFFAPNYAFHAGNLPGRNDSHGCVRVSKPDAQWLNENFINIGTKVIIRPYPEKKK